jgi:hypothetical protein
VKGPHRPRPGTPPRCQSHRPGRYGQAARSHAASGDHPVLRCRSWPAAWPRPDAAQSLRATPGRPGEGDRRSSRVTRRALAGDLDRLQNRGARDGPLRATARPSGTWRRGTGAGRCPGLPPGGRPPCAEGAKAEWPYHAAVSCGRIAPVRQATHTSPGSLAGLRSRAERSRHRRAARSARL